MKNYPKILLALALLFLFASCENEEGQSIKITQEAPTVRSKSKSSPSEQGASEEVSKPTSSDPLEHRADHRLWLGNLLRAEDQDRFEKWAKDLSRNPKELRHRKQQLAHLRRAEVITWDISDQDLQTIKLGEEPKEIKLPFFGGGTLTILAEKIQRYGAQSIQLQGHLVSDPQSKIHLNLSNHAPTAVIEGPESLYYYEAFEGVVILREDEPGSQHADADCGCEFHQATQ